MGTTKQGGSHHGYPELAAPARRWWALASVAAAQFLAVVDAFIVNVAIPSIRADLHADAAEIQAVVAVYQIAYAALVITGGRLGDIVGRKRVFITGVTRLHAGLAVVRAVGIGRDADLRPRRARRRCSDDGAAGARLDPHAVPRRCARARLRHLRRRDRPGRRGRLHARRLAGDAEPRRPRLAQHLLRQRADRRGHRARRGMADAGDAAQRRHAARPARGRRAVRRAARPGRAADVRSRTRLAVVALARDGGRRHDAGRLRTPAAQRWSDAAACR